MRKRMFSALSFIAILGILLSVDGCGNENSSNNVKKKPISVHNINLSKDLLISLRSNTAEKSYLYVLNPMTRKARILSINPQGLDGIAEDTEHQGAWIAPLGIYEQTQNKYLIHLDLKNGRQEQVSTSGEGPSAILATKQGVFVVTHGTGINGTVDKINPRTLSTVNL